MAWAPSAPEQRGWWHLRCFAVTWLGRGWSWAHGEGMGLLWGQWGSAVAGAPALWAALHWDMAARWGLSQAVSGHSPVVP